MAILLTGATGFVGRHVRARADARGTELVAAEGDLRDPETARREVARARPRAVIHVAARPRTSPRPWETLAEEIRMTGNVLTAVSELAPGAAVLVPGSAGQYGVASARPLREGDPMAPVNAYATMKCVLERAATSTALTGEARVIWARSFNILGPGQGRDAPIPAWAAQIAALERDGGGTLHTGNLDVVRDFLDVRDVADLFLDLVATPFQGVVNVASGVGVSLRTVVETLVAEAKVPIAVAPDPALARRVDPPHVVADVSRLRELVASTPAFGLHDSLTTVLDEWRAQPVESGVR